MMNGSNSPTQLADSQPEPDSKPPDPGQRTGPHAAVEEQSVIVWVPQLSTNKTAAPVFIALGLATPDLWRQQWLSRQEESQHALLQREPQRAQVTLGSSGTNSASRTNKTYPAGTAIDGRAMQGQRFANHAPCAVHFVSVRALTNHLPAAAFADSCT